MVWHWSQLATQHASRWSYSTRSLTSYLRRHTSTLKKKKTPADSSSCWLAVGWLEINFFFQFEDLFPGFVRILLEVQRGPDGKWAPAPLIKTQNAGRLQSWNNQVSQVSLTVETVHNKSWSMRGFSMAPLSKTRVPLNRCEQSTHFYSASWWIVLDVAVPVLHSTVPFTERFQTPSNAITYIFNRIIWDWIDCFFF